MDRATLEPSSSTTEKAQFWIWPEAAVPDPSTEEFILARDPEAGEVSMGNRSGARRRVDNGTRIGIFLLVESRQAGPRFLQFGQLHAPDKIGFFFSLPTQNPILERLISWRLFFHDVAFPFSH